MDRDIQGLGIRDSGLGLRVIGGGGLYSVGSILGSPHLSETSMY